MNNCLVTKQFSRQSYFWIKSNTVQITDYQLLLYTITATLHFVTRANCFILNNTCNFAFGNQHEYFSNQVASQFSFIKLIKLLLCFVRFFFILVFLFVFSSMRFQTVYNLHVCATKRCFCIKAICNLLKMANVLPKHIHVHMHSLYAVKITFLKNVL